jgi:hypothetical protein
MMFHFRLFLLACVFLASGRVTTYAGESPLKVLFIGNSYTYVNDLPSLVVGLTDAAGGRKIETGQHLVGGCTLERHVKDKKAIDKIREKKWDVVVLQGHSLEAILDPETMQKYARVLCPCGSREKSLIAGRCPWRGTADDQRAAEDAVAASVCWKFQGIQSWGVLATSSAWRSSSVR